MHVDGRSERPLSGSRINDLEAATIALWLQENKAQLEQDHGKSLAEIVGIITPFKAQTERIKAKCCELGLDDELEIGTVHAFQGAQKRIVLFSAVYSRHDGEGFNFIDSDNSMLNVAVSRAQDSFVVFGDIDALAAAPVGAPRRLLADYLLKNEANQIEFTISSKRQDLLAYDAKPQILTNSEEHDQWLMDISGAVQKQLVMVSPWLSLSRLEHVGFIALFLEMVKRGVQVVIYTDYRFNCVTGRKVDQERVERLKMACQQLSSRNISVRVVRSVHSKIVMLDDNVLCIGSYNWASAARQGDYKNLETSMVYRGDVAKEIELQLNMLENALTHL